MKYHVPMPSLGADMDQGKLMEWKIKAGDEVKKGQAIAVVETTKSTVDIESFREGKVLELVGKIGEQISVGAPIAIFEVEGSDLAPSAPEATKEIRLKVSPAARKLAQERHIDLTTIKGSGPEGQIELKDLETIKTPEKSGVNIREAIARAMSKSKKEIPHYYLKSQVPLDALMNWLDGKNQQLPPEKRLMLPVVIYKAVIDSVKESPLMNGYYEGGVFKPSSSIHVGLAIALKSGGVLVPAIIDADKMSLTELNAAFLDLVERTQKGELRNRELTEGTFTITSMGDLGSDEVFGIIFPPQVSIIGLGRMHRAPVIDGSSIRIGIVMNITLSADHRVSDGLNGARFLSHIENKLKNPDQWEGKL